MAEFVLKKEQMDKFKPAKLTQTERVELESITRHPGMTVLLEKVMGAHVAEQLNQVHGVDLEDPQRSSKLDAICAVAHAMALNLALTKLELELNWKELRAQEEKRARETEQNETEKTP